MMRVAVGLVANYKDWKVGRISILSQLGMGLVANYKDWKGFWFHLLWQICHKSLVANYKDWKV